MTSLWLADAEHISADPWHPGARYDDIVVGAGLTGLMTGLLLARAGRRVAVVEARRAGAVATGNTTAKLSLLQGHQLSRIRSHHSADVVQAYVDGNVEGRQWMLRYCMDHGINVQRRPAYSFATTTHGVATLREELDVSREAGLDTEWANHLDVPFEITGAISLADQAQFDPMDVITALAADVRAHGGVVHEGVRVTGIRNNRSCVVETDAGEVTAERVVVATGTPILDRSLYFAKLEPQRSYAVSFGGVASPPLGMYLSVDQPSRSLRTAPRTGGPEQLLVGGNGHGVGRTRSELSHLRELREWTMSHFPDAEETYWWSAQDYAPADSVPFVGTLPRGGGRIFVATGYSKWGMTNAVAAALRLSAQMLGDGVSWAKPLPHRITGPRTFVKGAMMNGEVGAFMAAGWAGAALRSMPDESPTEGDGVVGRRGIVPVAVSTVDGTTCELTAVCTHLGGIVKWNDAEKSWDCPLHGSRFAPDGTVLEGPATSALKPRSTES